VRLIDEGRYYCMAKNKFGNETINGLLLVRSKNFTVIVVKTCSVPVTTSRQSVLLFGFFLTCLRFQVWFVFWLRCDMQFVKSVKYTSFFSIKDSVVGPFRDPAWPMVTTDHGELPIKQRLTAVDYDSGITCHYLLPRYKWFLLFTLAYNT